MPINKFKFVSPGVQVAEIDNSQLPSSPVDVGPTIIGRSLRGPGLMPIKISSMSEFANIFGMPQAGDAGNDPWRTGPDTLAPTYGCYAAQAYLRNSSTITFVRLLGYADANNDGTTAGGVSAKAGWKVPSPTLGGAGGAMGLFVFPSGNIRPSLGMPGGADANTITSQAAALTGTLAAIFYCSTGSVFLVGNDFAGIAVSGTSTPVKCDSNGNLKAVVIPQGQTLQGAALSPGVGTITTTSDTVADYDDKTFTMESTDGTSVIYTLDDDTGTNTYGASTTTIGIQGGPNKEWVVGKIQDAIDNASNAHYGKLTTSKASATVTVTQVVVGTAGNLSLIHI